MCLICVEGIATVAVALTGWRLWHARISSFFSRFRQQEPLCKICGETSAHSNHYYFSNPRHHEFAHPTKAA